MFIADTFNQNYDKHSGKLTRHVQVYTIVSLSVHVQINFVPIVNQRGGLSVHGALYTSAYCLLETSSQNCLPHAKSKTRR
jgi:hypothetical protein